MLSHYIEAIKKVDIWKSKLTLVMIALGILTNFSIWILFYFKVEPNVYPIPLHFNIYTGIDVVDYWYKVFVIPGFGLFLLLVNSIVGAALYKREKFIAYLLLIGNLCVQIILLVAGIVLTQKI